MIFVLFIGGILAKTSNFFAKKMKPVRYYLAKVGIDGTAQIQFRTSIKISAFDSVRVTYGTRLYIAPKDWDRKRQRVKSPERYWINNELNKLDNLSRQIIQDRIQAGTIGKLTYDNFKAELDARYTGYDPNEQLIFNVIADNFLNDHYPKHKKYNASTAQRIKIALGLFIDANGQIEIAQLNEQSLLSFLQYLRKSDYTDNYISTQLSKVLQVANFLSEAGLPINQEVLSLTPGDLGVKRQKGFKIALTIGEIKQLYNHQYSAEYLRRVVDVFTVQCFTGLRYSNWKDVNQDNIRTIDKTDILDVTAVKNSARVVLPVHPIIKTVLEKYGGKLPVISEQKSRDYLKIAASEAGFNQIINKRTTRGAVQIEKVLQSELFTCHVSRNTFNSNALDAGIPDRDVKKFMGHSVKDMTDTYDRRSPERIALRYSQHSFFNDW